jgi:hypothetical protein
VLDLPQHFLTRHIAIRSIRPERRWVELEDARHPLRTILVVRAMSSAGIGNERSCAGLAEDGHVGEEVEAPQPLDPSSAHAIALADSGQHEPNLAMGQRAVERLQDLRLSRSICWLPVTYLARAHRR